MALGAAQGAASPARDANQDSRSSRLRTTYRT
eukprot:CAMPEP_0180707458 /NCGR_PEP_ID=MMETSP1038_2-20121128/8725_1 /TAXON_ID=632150 /ORGANISM="Azadinium spinosum, Strain 3D9" /LENGTH=31 /DNA_ID= /DNA_START= /DNA_END= /DNA_ORIENTATION=